MDLNCYSHELVGTHSHVVEEVASSWQVGLQKKAALAVSFLVDTET